MKCWNNFLGGSVVVDAPKYYLWLTFEINLTRQGPFTDNKFVYIFLFAKSVHFYSSLEINCTLWCLAFAKFEAAFWEIQLHLCISCEPASCLSADQKTGSHRSISRGCSRHAKFWLSRCRCQDFIQAQWNYTNSLFQLRGFSLKMAILIKSMSL